MYKIKEFKDGMSINFERDYATDRLNEFLKENYITDYEVLFSEVIKNERDLSTCIIIKYKETPDETVVVKNDKPLYIGESRYDALKFLSSLDFLSTQEAEDIMFENIDPTIEHKEDVYKIIKRRDINGFSC